MEVGNCTKEIDELMTLVNVNVNSVHGILDELQSRYENQLKVQEKVISTQMEMINEQDMILDDLQSKLLSLEEHVIFPSHISTLSDRISDNNEQNARKLNLKIEGIEVFQNDSPELVMKFIKSEIQRLDLDIADHKFAAAERVGLKYYKDGKVQQSIILKLTCALARNKIYINRNNFKFYIQVDLTSSREALLNFAKYEISNGLNSIASRVIDSVYADLNGTLHLKSKTGMSFGFSSESEFLSLVSWLDKEF